MRRHLSATLLLVILCSLVLSACGSARRTPQITTPVTVTTAPTGTRTVPIVTNTPYASQTPRPGGGTRTPIYPTHPPTETPVTPTATPFPASTPVDGPEAYRLKPWDYRTAFRLLDEAENILLPEEYENLRPFYKLSMLEEIYLKMPEYKTDIDLLENKAGLKGLRGAYWDSYGLLHNYEVAPFQEWLEQNLNLDGVLPPTAESWMEKYFWVFSEPKTSNRLFDQSTPAMIIQVRGNVGWGFFVIREDTYGRFTVHALNPEWKQESWDEETFQITDLNANGRDEIAVEYHGWGTGMSHFCSQGFKVYEWNGNTFENLFEDELYFVTGTNYSDCLPITFPNDPNGGNMVQTGIYYNSVCPDEPYEKIITFRWNGESFRKQPDSMSNPPNPESPNHCTIDWVMDAERLNDTAVDLLEDVLSKWPTEAEQTWGPAVRDFLRLKLAAWYIERGKVDQGLTMLTDIRDHPYTPEFQVAPKVADVFLTTYENLGFYRAVETTRYQYFDELLCTYEGCSKEKMLKTWGVFDQDWEYTRPPDIFTNKFVSTGSLSWEIDHEQPESLDELNMWLNRIGKKPVWFDQSDLDGDNEEDWLVVITEKSDQYDLYDTSLLAFLQRKNRFELINFENVYFDSSAPIESPRMEVFYPESDVQPIIIFQIEDRLYAFHFIQEGDKSQLIYDLISWHISSVGLEENRVRVKDWKIENEELIVQYDGREAVYVWDVSQQQLIPTGFAPDLQEENISKAEQAVYFDNDPTKAVEILNGMLEGRIWEDFSLAYDGVDSIRPYAMYLLGLAYEQASDSDNAVRAYWQLWHEYPTNPYSIAAQSKLERK